jgi:predicted nucleic acid-binding protein
MDSDTHALASLVGACEALHAAAADLAMASALARSPSLATDAHLLALAVEGELDAVLGALRRRLHEQDGEPLP